VTRQASGRIGGAAAAAVASALRSCRGARAGLRREVVAAAASEQLREAGAAPPPVRSPVRSRPSESGGAGVEVGEGKHLEPGGLRRGEGKRKVARRDLEVR
jgi:hypothetical protein